MAATERPKLKLLGDNSVVLGYEQCGQIVQDLPMSREREMYLYKWGEEDLQLSGREEGVSTREGGICGRS